MQVNELSNRMELRIYRELLFNKVLYRLNVMIGRSLNFFNVFGVLF